MLILIVGAKGGVGTTTLAQHLCRYTGAVSLDAADGKLALAMTKPGVRVLDLSRTSQWTVSRRSYTVEQVVETAQPLLWTLACSAWHTPIVDFVREIAVLGHVVADGGIAPPAALIDVASFILIVSADDPVAQWHEQRLKEQWPQARAVVGDLKAAAQAIAEQALGVQIRKKLSAFSFQRSARKLQPQRKADR